MGGRIAVSGSTQGGEGQYCVLAFAAIAAAPALRGRAAEREVESLTAQSAALSRGMTLGEVKGFDKLKALAEDGKLPAAKVAEAIQKYGIQADKVNPLHA
mgnify:CR=1 FL=1